MNILELKRKLLPMSGPQMSMGGGGGGGSGTGTQTQISELPEWARGYAKSTLEKGAALSEKPYQTYNAPRIAGFSDLQQQAQAAAGPQGFQKTVGQYMSPYQQNVTDVQKQEAARQSGIAGTQQAAQATQQGAFGGGRDAIMRAERERNLGRQMNDIQAVGSQNAYNNATQQYNQGLQQMSAFGGQQQALQQQGLTQAYEDFQNQNNYGYKQLGFMSDLIRGLPLGQQTATQMYAPNPSMAQNVAALGAGAYGLSKFMAEGGMAYADGGSVDSSDNVERIVSKLSDQQLQQAAQAAQVRGDQDQLEAIQSEMAMRASLKHGIAGGVTDSMVQKMAGGGGVLAFKDEGLVPGEDDDRDRMVVSAGNKKYYDTAGSYAMDALDRLRARKGYQGLSRSERAALDQENFDRINRFGGEDPYAPMAEKIKGLEEAATKNYERAQGASILAALPKILEGGNAARGIAGGLGAYGTQMEQADRAHAAERRGLAGINFNLSDAQRKERMAAGREAIGTTKDIEANRLAADAAERKALTEEITGASTLAKAYRPVGGAGGAGGKAPKLNERLYDDNVANLLLTQKPNEGETDAQFNARIRAKAGELTAKQVKDMGQTRADAAAATLTAAQNRTLAKHMSDFEESTAYKKAVKAGNAEAVYNAEAARKQQELMGGITKLARGGNIEPIKLD